MTDYELCFFESVGDCVCSVRGELKVFTKTGIIRKNFDVGYSRGEWGRVFKIKPTDTQQALDFMKKIIEVRAKDYMQDLHDFDDTVGC